jgi:GNAT superfamily N-acetyltransferase
MRTSISLRPLAPQTDFPRLAQLYTAVEPEPVTVAQLQEWETQIPQGYILHRMVALDPQGQIIGLNEAGRDLLMPPGLFDIHVLVDPTWRQQGVGTLLYQDALHFSQQQGAARLQDQVRDNCAACLRFAERQGFHIERHSFESTLDLATFDERRFAGHIESVESAGIRFFTLADLGNTEEAQRRLYTLNERLTRDIPGYQSWLSFEGFQAQVCGASWYRADGQMVAAMGEAWVGMAAVGFFATTQSMYNMMTGIERPFRGRGIALALKLLTVRCAHSYRAVYLRTNNDAENAPMLAINRKLGYRPTSGLYRVVLELPS